MNFLDRFLKNDQISNLMKIGPVGADLLRADGLDANSRSWQFFLTGLKIKGRYEIYMQAMARKTISQPMWTTK